MNSPIILQNQTMQNHLWKYCLKQKLLHSLKLVKVSYRSCANFHKNGGNNPIFYQKLTVHDSLSAVTHAPFMRQCWGLPHRQAQCMSLQGWDKLLYVALLSVINEACVGVCCATLLSSELVGPTFVQARSSNPRGRACSLMGRDRGRRGYWVTLCLFI